MLCKEKEMLAYVKGELLGLWKKKEMPAFCKGGNA